MMAVEQRHHVGSLGGHKEQSWMMGDQQTNSTEANYQDYNGYQDKNKNKEDMESGKGVARNGEPISVEHGQGDHEPQGNTKQDKEIRKKFDTPYPKHNSPRTSSRVEQNDSSQSGKTRELNGSEKLEWENEEGEESSPPPRAPSRQNTDDSEDDDSGLLMNMTEDQRQAMEELKNMKLDLAYTADEDPPEYDVAERVRQLNEELANEPSPDEDRERAIKFKDNLVDLVAPPPDVDGEEEEDNNPQNEGQEGGSENSEQKNNYDDDDDWQDEEDETDDGPQSVTETSDSDKGKQQGQKGKTSAANESNARSEDKVLVERNGKFELLSANDLTPEERDMYFGETTDSEPFSTARSDGSSQSGGHQPTPPKNPRPATANGTTKRRRDGRRSAPPGRAQSASLTTYNDPLENFNYTSPYALSPRDKKQLQKEQDAKEKREKQEKQLHQMEEEEKQQERNEAFMAWLKKKREEKEERKKMEKEEKNEKEDESSDKESDSQADSETIFKEWLKRKKQQQKQEKNIEQYQKKEEEENAHVRPRSECRKAYKEWLKKKKVPTATLR